MTISKIEEFYSLYDSALEWALSIVQTVPKHCRRYFEYKENLKHLINDQYRQELIQPSKHKELLAQSEAISEAQAMIEVFKKFKSRQELKFKTKLRESFYGPTFMINEKKGGSKSKGSHGRNILSELLFASRFKNSNKVNFQEHDLVYELGELKIGVEVKRIQEGENIVGAFADACKQIQSNPTTKYGIVALRLDKYYFATSKGKILFSKPLLLPRQDMIFRGENNEEIYKLLEVQTLTFRDQFDAKLLDWINQTEYKKIIGYCVFIHSPALINEPLSFFPASFASHQPWERQSDPKHREIYKTLIGELDFPE
jgi:hypothetical protein